MKNSMKKVMAGISAVAMLAAAMPVANVFAADEASVSYKTREVAQGLIITDCATDDEKVEIPADINGKTVVGVDAFAFGLCDNLATVVVPASLDAQYVDTNAFMTKTMVEKYVIPSDVNTVEGLLQYYAELAGATYNDAMLSRFMNHIKDVKIDNGTTVSDLAIYIARDIDNLGFSETNIKRFEMYTNLISYDTLTMVGPADSSMKGYASKKTNLKYVDLSASKYELGDVDRNEKLNIFDAVAVARYSVNKEEFDEEQLALADFDGNGKVNIFDAVEIARFTVS